MGNDFQNVKSHIDLKFYKGDFVKL